MAAKILFDAAISFVAELCASRGWMALEREILQEDTGYQAIWVIDAPAMSLKAAMVDAEDRHPLGRLWDMDVVSPESGPLSRSAIGHPARACLICDEPAHACSRSRRHDRDELLVVMAQRIMTYLNRACRNYSTRTSKPGKYCLASFSTVPS
ncbi:MULTISPECIES: citrate lyase holo-[acyl-carrier protein] synthase [Brenneria]|uniref:citrate lyase holo-[acyl-carrier protein] synthase n=1 Tax=Brenneria TaxID=71655 RepID=UPI0006814CF1|nr:MULTISPECIES: citrate lyase holo-[acyl-carrier protein] synthase [Brenneria]